MTGDWASLAWARQDSNLIRKLTEPSETLISSYERPGRMQKSPARALKSPKHFQTFAVHDACSTPAPLSGAQDRPHALLTCPPNAAPKSLPSRTLSAPAQDPAAKHFLLHRQPRSRDLTESGARTASPEGRNSVRRRVRAFYEKA